VMIAMMGGIYLMPIFLQSVIGLTPMETGLVLMPQSIAMAFMMPVAGKLVTKFGVVPLAVIGLTTIGATTLELHVLTQQTSSHWISMLLIVRGIGIGLCMMPLTSAGMNTLPNHLIGRASSLSNVIRNVMASFGIALLTSIMSNRTTVYGTKIAEHISPDSPAFAEFSASIAHRYIELGTSSSAASSGVSSVLAGLVQKEALTRGIVDTFVISAIPAFIALIMVLFMIRRKRAAVVEAKPDGTEPGAHVMIEM
jgi:MFS family permease